jgi:nucleoside-diphosphate-sugar epimerase
MKRVFLTGASGFVGQYCVPLLIEKGFEIFALSRNETKSDSKIHWVRADLSEASRIDSLLKEIQPEYLLHLAWYAKHGLYWNASENFDCVAQSLSLLKSFASHGGKRVVMAGSCAEYDWKQPLCKEEEISAISQGLYGTCKSALHRMSLEYSRLQGLKFAWGRIFYLFGPNEQRGRLIPSVISTLSQGKEFTCAQGDLYRDFLFVKDVADAFVSLLDSSVQGSLNIASGKVVSIKQMVQWIGEKMDAKDRIRFLQGNGEPKEMIAEAKRLSNEVHWQGKFDLRAALDQTIQWWKDQPIA